MLRNIDKYYMLNTKPNPVTLKRSGLYNLYNIFIGPIRAIWLEIKSKNQDTIKLYSTNCRLWVKKKQSCLLPLCYNSQLSSHKALLKLQRHSQVTKTQDTATVLRTNGAWFDQSLRTCWGTYTPILSFHWLLVYW